MAGFAADSIADTDVEINRAGCRPYAVDDGERRKWLLARDLLGCYVGGVVELRGAFEAGGNHAAFDLHGGGNEGLVVTIKKPKTRRLWHTQFVLIRDRALINWLLWWTAGVSGNRVLFRVPRRRWAKVFEQAL